MKELIKKFIKIFFKFYLNITFFTTKNSIIIKSKLIMIIHKNADKKVLPKKVIKDNLTFNTY